MTRTMVQAIIQLPTSVSAAVLCDWLDVKWICRLDSAICIKSSRPAFLELLRSVECIGQLHIINNVQLVWANMRSIRSNYFAVYDDFSEEECEKFLRRSGPHVQNIFLHYQSNRVSIAGMAQFFHNLLRFEDRLVADNSALECLLLLNPQLRDLTLSGNYSDPVPDVALPNLVSLRLSGSAFDDNACLTLLKRASHLRYLAFFGTSVTSAGLIDTARFCQQLRFFRPPNVNNIDFTLLKMSPSLSMLQYISLVYCESLSDAGIIAVAESVHALRSIHLAYSPHITNACLASLARHQYRTLEIFAIEERPFPLQPRNTLDEDSRTFDDEAVTSFREKCFRLRVFDWKRSLEMFTRYSYETIFSQLFSADRVTTLVLTFATDEILYTIARHCALLQVLQLYEYVSTEMGVFSDAAILEVLDRCNNLSTIMVRKLHQREMFLKHIAAYPKVTVPDQIVYFSWHDFDSLYRNNGD
eukprot:CAMPEP_0184995854 /NCGR_PEP_ID=MMETSP1098-20130426/54291_1 /TAXON_ID=89044 /ORGANISM="Spumella elongata, Strain CCAP 955/1" /LENGTH=470 /DNA_ID=CAMNT_0027522195 /DNA_START=17 /DNA_END=1429 /DNA_ORIENTATION=+